MKILSERKRSHLHPASSSGLLPEVLQSIADTPSATSSKIKIEDGQGDYSRNSTSYGKAKNGVLVPPTEAVKNTIMTLSEIYHEKQVRALCALHALNNLFQGPYFKKDDLDSICNTLAPDAWLNPHKSVLGLGNYDINVIMTALQIKDYEAIWFDKRKDPATLNLPAIFGFIFNIPTDCKFGWVSLPMKRKHWYAVKCFGEDYYNLDSKIDSPLLIGKESAVITFFREELQSKEKELFLVMNQEISRTQSWNQTSNQLLTLFDGNASSSLSPGSIRKESADSGVVELLDGNSDLNIVDLDKEPSEDERLRF